MRLSGTKATAIHQYRGLGNQLWDLAGNRPSLDLRFADEKSLVDATTGTNLVDFSRASSGTYVGSDGLIKTATTNYLLQSEDLTAGDWVPIGTVSATLDTSQGQPLENVNVHRIDFSGANEQYRQSYNFANATYTASAYVKGVAGETIRLAIPGAIAVTLTLDGTWQPIFVSGAVSAGINYFSFTTAAGATARTVYVAAPQLEQSSTVGEYVKTTSTINSAPRFDHHPTTGESLGLLVEESRTNLLLNSATNVEFSNGSSPNTWTGGQTAPDGSATAKICTTNNRSFIDYSASETANNPITYSVFLKATSPITRTLDLRQFSSDLVLASKTINITTDWQRFNITGTSTVNGCRIEIIGGIQNISAWGAQLEAGSFPTSYIPTTTATVTRAADVASISGSAFASFYNQTEGTIYAEATPREFTNTDGIVSIDNDSGAERIQIRTAGNTGALNFIVVDNNSVQSNTSTSNYSVLNRTNKYSAAYKLNSFASCLNAGSTTSGTGTVPTPTQLQIGIAEALSESYFNGPIGRVCYWSQRLPNSTLSTITQ